MSDGHIFIVSAPSGAGKTTLVRAVRDRYPEIRYSVSFTSRAPRPGERDGVDYHFLTRPDFAEGIERGRWAEWAEVHGNFYGTSAELLDRYLAEGNDVILDIDVQGALQILKRYPESITIFIMPPSKAVLRDRLEARGGDSREVIEKRMANADAEMASRHLYRHVIVNDRLDDAVAELVSLISGYRRAG